MFLFYFCKHLDLLKIRSVIKIKIKVFCCSKYKLFFKVSLGVDNDSESVLKNGKRRGTKIVVTRGNEFTKYGPEFDNTAKNLNVFHYFQLE